MVSPMPRRPFRNIILPAMILFPLMILLIGCLYIPTFEHVDTQDAKQDFRPLLNATGSTQSISQGTLTKTQVEALLGKPFVQSDNGRAVTYFVTAEQGIWVEPQCFAAFWAKRTLHVLSLKYDANGTVETVAVFNIGCAQSPDGINFMANGEPNLREAMRQAVAKINADNGVAETHAAVHSLFYIYPSSTVK
jgi:hypothetical protein